MRHFSIGLAALVLARLRNEPGPGARDRRFVGIADMVGEWTGQYTSPDTRRSGNVRFGLQAGRDTAFGDIVMVPGVSLGGQPDVPWPGGRARGMGSFRPRVSE